MTVLTIILIIGLLIIIFGEDNWDALGFLVVCITGAIILGIIISGKLGDTPEKPKQLDKFEYMVRIERYSNPLRDSVVFYTDEERVGAILLDSAQSLIFYKPK